MANKGNVLESDQKKNIGKHSGPKIILYIKSLINAQIGAKNIQKPRYCKSYTSTVKYTSAAFPHKTVLTEFPPKNRANRGKLFFPDVPYQIHIIVRITLIRDALIKDPLYC